VTLAHVGGAPVEEALLPLVTALMLSGAWLPTRVRAVHRRQTREP
jgi:hypothetical protein